MSTKASLSLRPASVLLVVALLASPGQGAEINKYIPQDTQVLISLNVRQVLASPLVQQVGVDQLRELLNSVEEVADFLQELGFDPLKDLTQVTVASPGGEDEDRGLVLLEGTFNQEKIRARAEEEIKKANALVRLHRVADGLGGAFQVYEIGVPSPDLPLFVAVPSRGILLASPGKDYVVDALKKESLKKHPGLNNKDFQSLLEKLDPAKSFTLAALGSALREGEAIPEGPFKAMLENVEALGGGVSIVKDIDIEVVIGMKTGEDARELNKSINDALTQGLGLLALLALQEPQLQPVLDVVKTLRSSCREKNVILRGQIGLDVVEKAFPPA